MSNIDNRGPEHNARNHATNKQRAGDVLFSVGETIYEWDIEQDQISWTENAAGLFGVADADKIATGRSFTGLVAPHSATNRSEAVFGTDQQDDGEGVRYQIQYALAAEALGVEQDVWLEDTGRWFAGSNGNPAKAHGIVRVINERRAREERLDRLTRFDDLTSLYNRGYLNECLEVEIREAEIQNTSLALLLVALDRFELINSIYGYDAGDHVIAEIAERMRSSLRSGDVIGRFSGAKLGVILKNCNENELRHAGMRFINNIGDEVVETERGPVSVTASIGGVVLPRHATTIRAASSAVQTALEQARTERHPRLVAYKPDPQAEEKQRAYTKLAGEIVSAVQGNRLQLAYQPVVDADSHSIAFHEALVRMVREDGTILPASEFVGVANDLGLIRMVDHQAMELTLDVLMRAPQAKLSLNVSIETSNDPDWLSRLATVVRSRPDVAHRLIVEITESHAATDLDETARFVEIIKELGCKTAVDDFGAGFTSFSNLKHLPVDIIKVDGQFVENLANSHENQSFVRSLVQLAGVFDTKTVVEWVEDDETALLLKDWGVDYLQGYGIGAPIMTAPWPMDPPDDDDQSTGNRGLMSA